MKKYFNHFGISYLLILLMVFTSCQEEFEPLPDGEEKETMKVNSSTAQLIQKTSNNDGSFDNIVDGASCLAIKFPYTVEVKEVQITINSLEDLQIIERIFDEIDDDADILDIVFPITIILADFTEITVNTIADLAALAAECKEGGDDDDIECIDFVYPISFFTFDTSFEQTGSITIENDKQLRRFFAGLEGDDIISIDFPVTLELYDGSKITTNTNAELASAIESVKEVCDEDDDNDFNDDDFSLEGFDARLVDCPWLVKEVQRNDMDRTTQYKNYEFAFTEEGKVAVKNREGNVLNGTWNASVDDDGAKLTMEFEELVDFNLEWRVYAIDDRRIKLYNGESNKIIMKQICEGEENNYDADMVAINLKECDWLISKLSTRTPDLDRFIHGFTINFDTDDKLLFTNGIYVDPGKWTVGNTNQNKVSLTISLTEELIDKEWVLEEATESRLTFVIAELGEELILEKSCSNDYDANEATVREYMTDGSWMVSSYTENNEDLTSELAGNIFEFSTDGTVPVTFTNQVQVTLGTWRVFRNSLQDLKFFVVLGDGEVGAVSDNWLIQETTSTQLILKYTDGAIDKTLVFDKNM